MTLDTAEKVFKIGGHLADIVMHSFKLYLLWKQHNDHK